MKIIFLLVLTIIFAPLTFSQDNPFKIPELKLSNNYVLNSSIPEQGDPKFKKKRKTVTTYAGAGYSFVIFTAKEMNEAYPVFDTRKGDFLSEINLYFGFAIAQALTLEIEPSILFTHNDRQLKFTFDPPIKKNGVDYRYVFSYNLSLLAFPVAANVRFFPAYKATGFGRLFFIGGGAGFAWIREEYDNVYTNDPNGSTFGTFFTESTSQWQPVFRVMTGFTGTGGQFGFGGEIRYNIIPLKQTAEPFVTRSASNFNSVDLSLRFYFSL